MRVLMCRGTVGPDGLACEVGAVVDLPDALARHWIAIGRAAVVSDASPDTPLSLTHADPVPAVAEPPKRKRR